jgi:hypothetical protein
MIIHCGEIILLFTKFIFWTNKYYTNVQYFNNNLLNIYIYIYLIQADMYQITFSETFNIWTKLKYSCPATRHAGAKGRGDVAPTHSWLGRWMGWVVSVTPRRALPPGKGPPVPIVQEAGWASDPVWAQRVEEKFFRVQSCLLGYTAV